MVAAALLAVAAIVGVAWLTTLQPMTFADRVTRFGGETIPVGDRDEHRWTWTEGERFAVGTWLRNDGPVPIRVTAITLPDVVVPWDQWRVTLGRDERRFTTEPEHPFEPFTLDPDERQLVWFRGDFLRCPDDFAPGTSGGVSNVDVTFEVLGMAQHEIVDLGFAYSVLVPESGC